MGMTFADAMSPVAPRAMAKTPMQRSTATSANAVENPPVELARIVFRQVAPADTVNRMRSCFLKPVPASRSGARSSTRSLGGLDATPQSGANRGGGYDERKENGDEAPSHTHRMPRPGLTCGVLPEMKRSLFLLVFAFALALSACGTGSESKISTSGLKGLVLRQSDLKGPFSAVVDGPTARLRRPRHDEERSPPL